MGGPIPVPPAFPTVIPNPINPNTPGFLISSFEIVSSTEVTLFFANNLRVGDTVLFGGLRTLAALNNTSLTIAAQAPSGSTKTAYNPTANGLTIKNPGTIPAGLSGLIVETGVVTRLTPAPRQPALFFTDPANYEPPTDGSGPLIITKTVMSVEHPGRQIPDMIIGSVLRMARATLTSSQIHALHTTPVQLIPEPEFVPSGLQGTPGRRLAYSVKDVHFRLNAGTTHYSGGELNLFLGPPANSIELLEAGGNGGDPSQILSKTEDTMILGAPLKEIEARAGLVENQPIMVGSKSAASGGNGTLTIIVEYVVVQT